MILENEKFKMEFTCEGGEMTSFFNKDLQLEYLYQGDSEFWKGKNPTLFPIVGNTYTNQYEAKGKTYTFKNHGLIRYATLTCVNHTKDSITFELQSNEETLQTYPYAFTYQITYTLIGNKVEIVYTIKNDDAEVMPFTFGLHPGFKVPLMPNETFEDYTLAFEQEEQIQHLIFNDNNVRYVPKIIKEWQLDYVTMEKYSTLICKDYSSSFVTLTGKEGHGVKMSIAGYPVLAVWTQAKGAPFLCIEPWYSHADFEDVKCAFKDRFGMLSLDPNKMFTTSYTIELF